MHFVGATLWTNFDIDPKQIDDARFYMNDYHCISNGDKPLQPEDTLQENMDTKKWFDQCVPVLKQAPIVMITHHAPSVRSLHGRYLNSAPAYANHMEEFIKKHPAITHWFSGHCHFSNDYMIEQCRMISNPGGYHKCEENASFDIGMEVDVDAILTGAASEQ